MTVSICAPLSPAASSAFEAAATDMSTIVSSGCALAKRRSLIPERDWIHSSLESICSQISALVTTRSGLCTPNPRSALFLSVAGTAICAPIRRTPPPRALLISAPHRDTVARVTEMSQHGVQAGRATWCRPVVGAGGCRAPTRYRARYGRTGLGRAVRSLGTGVGRSAQPGGGGVRDVAAARSRARPRLRGGPPLVVARDARLGGGRHRLLGRRSGQGPPDRGAGAEEIA